MAIKDKTLTVIPQRINEIKRVALLLDMAFASDDLLVLNVATLFTDGNQACSCADGQFVASGFMAMHQS